MHTHSLAPWEHSHTFLSQSHHRNERRTRLVVGLTAAMMIAEIAAGSYFGSMALLADGWHMMTHVGALSLSAMAYALARREAGNRAFTFGTGKFGELAGFASAIILALISLFIAYESASRIITPVPIDFNAALGIAAIGLLVNLVSALVLQEGGVTENSEYAHSHHAHDHHGSGHHDHNLRSAYVHVLADALTSVLAIVALLAGKWLHWEWMDPAVGVVGAIIIARWSYALIRDTSRVLLDMEADSALAQHIRADFESEGNDRLAGCGNSSLARQRV